MRQLIVILALLCVQLACAQNNDLDDELEEYGSGLIGSYRDAITSFQQIDSTIAFQWGSDSPDPRLRDDGFEVTWSGFLLTQGRGDFQFHVYAQGAVRVELDQQVLIEQTATEPTWSHSKPIELAYGYHPITIRFRKSAPNARIGIYWEGPQFQREPIPARLWFHDPAQFKSNQIARGEELVQALRCAACHDAPGLRPTEPAPSLTKINGYLNRGWLVDWLSNNESTEPNSRRMPHFGFSKVEAEAIESFLFAQSKQALDPSDNSAGSEKKKPKEAEGTKEKKGKASKPKTPEENLASGRQLALTIGCIACHQLEGLGQAGLFGGGDLSAIAIKRPSDFFSKWLKDPQSINADHRMPVFDLSGSEITELATYLATLKSDGKESNPKEDATELSSTAMALGEQLVRQANCVACHALSEKETLVNDKAAKGSSARIPLTQQSNWNLACSTDRAPTQKQPTYRLIPADQNAIREHLIQAQAIPNHKRPKSAKWLMTEHQCLACHARDLTPGLAPQLTAVADKFKELVPLIPAMTPPSLTSVGDKLSDKALEDAIYRKGDVHRPYLAVRMPRFHLQPEELATIRQHLTDADRIPDFESSVTKAYVDMIQDEREAAKELIAGSRLVTSDGFGCTSCHRVGKVDPPSAPLNARGPDLSMLSKRIRPEWFDRWTRNPSRIVPRMEMPSVQMPVQGLLDSQLDRQLVAVWHVLNRPGFQPPRPNPVRIVRMSGRQEEQERAVVLTDVLKRDETTWIKPFLVGLPNRHNLLIDLETNRIADWWLGDTARQHTQGKTWFWEIGGTSLLKDSATPSDLSYVFGERTYQATTETQFLTEYDEFQHIQQGIRLTHRLKFVGEPNATPTVLTLQQSIRPLWNNNSQTETGIRREIEIRGAAAGAELGFTIASLKSIVGDVSTSDRDVKLASNIPAQIRLVEPASANLQTDKSRVFVSIASKGPDQITRVVIDYITEVIPDAYAPSVAVIPPPKAENLKVVPGYEVTQLPLASEFMPTGIAWQSDGTMLIASLKGQVWRVRDTDGDGLEDQASVFSDELAAPYGIAAHGDDVDVVNKYSLVRLIDEDHDGKADRTVTLVSGWGHTADYHDWVVGLPPRREGGYYLAIPCQQDERSEAAAKYRGSVLAVVPHEPNKENPHRYTLQTISGGHRFPMGIAVNRHEELFVTDNQGNYNPFNELNHVLPGKRFGFINAIERKQPNFNPPLTPPAIDIPHPWTRSVNGLCFLESPEGLADQRHFGPYEGHLIGCEYDTRRLVRMSLDRVNGEIQGGVYPFTYEQPKVGSPLLGPVVCAVAPDGDLYVGSLRDSGWGGANNLGSLSRLRPTETMPAGIAEIRATPSGFRLMMTAPVDGQLALDSANYNIASYRRESTPAYGGPDLDRRTERVTRVSVSDDHREVTLEFDALRVGYLYEFQLKSLVAHGKEFFPAEGYYTLRASPSAVAP